ncbi:MAG: transposase [Cytophagales bacterium]|nr:transposase [Cytophagales bacterium]
MSSKHKIVDHQALHFITFATIQWIDALSRPSYKHIVVESLRYCQQEKGLILYAFVIMSNHVHLIASAAEGKSLSDILRDLKKYTSKQLLKELRENPQESRKSWMMWLFRSAGDSNSNNQDYQFWQQDNHPIELSTNDMMDQRLDYIHMNPVKEELVREPEHYPFSSAIDYAGGRGLLDLTMIS